MSTNNNDIETIEVGENCYCTKKLTLLTKQMRELKKIVEQQAKEIETLKKVIKSI